MAEATANLIERMGNQALFLDTRHPKLDSPAARTMREAAVALERVERTSWERIKQENQRAIDAEAQVEALRKALEGCVAWIVDLGESGDAGFWDGNQTPEVIAARAALAGSTPESSVEPSEPITWRGVSRIEYTHDELLDLLDTVRRNTGWDGHNIVSAFNGNTLTRLISQADLALRVPAEARSANG